MNRGDARTHTHGTCFKNPRVASKRESKESKQQHKRANTTQLVLPRPLRASLAKGAESRSWRGLKAKGIRRVPKGQQESKQHNIMIETESSPRPSASASRSAEATATGGGSPLLQQPSSLAPVGSTSTAAAAVPVPLAAATNAATSTSNNTNTSTVEASRGAEIDRLDRLVEMSRAGSSGGGGGGGTASPPPPPGPPPPPPLPNAGSGGATSSSRTSHGSGSGSGSGSGGGGSGGIGGAGVAMDGARMSPAAASHRNSSAGTSGSSHLLPPRPTSSPKQMIQAAAAGSVDNAAANEGPAASPFLVPRNPRDTMLTAGSPKRRIASQKGVAAAAAAAAAAGGVSGGGVSLENPSPARGTVLVGGAGGSAKILGNNSRAINAASGSLSGSIARPRRPSPIISGAASANNHVGSHRGGGSGHRPPTRIVSSGPLPPPPPPPPPHAGPSSAAAAHHIPTGPIILRTDPDSEEQAMFESRLCEDDFGVAVRKINHNGKSQLRYVRCIWLTTDSGGVGGDGGANNIGNGSGGGSSRNLGGVEGGIGPASPESSGDLSAVGTATTASLSRRGRSRNTSRSSGNSSVMSSSNRSVSSLMGRIRRSRSLSRDPSFRKSGGGGGGGGGDSIAGANPSLEGPISSPGMAVLHDDENGEDEARLLDTASSPLGLSGDGGAGNTKRMRALAWGNKKKVRIPLDRFVCVRKGKTTERTKRNSNPSSRLLSLITDDKANPSLDIEAPTKLDRDKFAKAFARFLDVPLVAEENSGRAGGGGSNKQTAAASVGALGSRGRKGAAAAAGEDRHESKSLRGRRSSSKKYISSAATAPDLNSPKSVLSSATTQSFATGQSTTGQSATSANGSTAAAAAASLLPPIQPTSSGDEDAKMSFTRMDASAASGSRGPSLGGYIGNIGAASSASGRPPRIGAANSMSSSNAGVVHSIAESSNALLSDAAMKRVEAEGEEDDAALLLHITSPRKEDAQAGANGFSNKGLFKQASAVGAATAAPTNQAVSPSIKIDHGQTHHHHHPHLEGENGEHAAEEGTVVSSLTQGFDQEIVEELHQALTELRAELESSRAEAARAVKVAEQAIQSAESCSASDWNSTVTHKAAEAAAQAQKRSAEAMAKQRLAEEKLASERKSAQFWRKQAEVAEQEAGLLTTRAVVAEVQKAEIEAALESERRKSAAYMASLKEDYEVSDQVRKAALADATERNRLLEIELNGTRNDLATRSEEAKMLHDTLNEVSNKNVKGKKMSFGMGRKKSAHTHVRGSSLLSGEGSGLSGAEIVLSPSDNLSTNQLLQLHSDAKNMRHQLEVLRRTTVDEISGLPTFAKEWVGRAATALAASQSETHVLREKLAMESSMRRKLLNEVQDMKGNVRVYCRPQSRLYGSSIDIASVPSSNVIMLHRDRIQTDDSTSAGPMSFEFDRVFSPDSDEKDIYSEVEELALGALDGYNVCLVAYGQNAAGKSHTMMGHYEVSLADAETPSATIVRQGIHFMAAQQLFTVAEHRSDRYQDCFTISIIEVHNEKLRDLLSGTRIGEECGQLQASPQTKNRKKSRNADDASQHGSSAGSRTGSKHTKLEIRTNYDGDTVVQGAITVEVKSFDDVCRVWQECLIERSARLAEQGIDEEQYVAECHVIATLSVVSTNVTTGIGTSGRIQFVDLASSELESSQRTAVAKDGDPTPTQGVLSGVGNSAEWKYTNKSLSTLLEVVTARSQFSRSVPYRNSTLTHLLRDSFTSDTKFLFLTNVSTDAQDLQNTASALRFASLMRKVNIGMATKHTVSLA